MKLPPVPLRAGESLDVQLVVDTGRVTFILTEVGEGGVWICRATFPLALVEGAAPNVTPEAVAHFIRVVLDDRMAFSKLTRQMQTS